VELYKPKTYDGRVLIYLAKVQSFFHLWQVEPCWKSIASAADFHPVSCMHDHMFREETPKQIGLHLQEYLLKVLGAPNPAVNQVGSGEV
jgi:hypothetical protein